MTGTQQSGAGGNPEFETRDKSVGGVSSAHAPPGVKRAQADEDIGEDQDSGPSRTSDHREPAELQQENDDESSQLD